MLQISRKTMLAIEAVVDVALHAQPDPVQSKEITRRQGVPQRYLEQVMQQLVHSGILRGVRGPKGGYILARERRRITVGEIVRIVDTMDTKDENQASKSQLNQQLIEPMWGGIESGFLAELDTITIEKLWQDARANDLHENPTVSRDFII